MTVFTIIFNNYGRFIPQWLDNLAKQTVKPKEIIIVLGKNHGADIDKIPSNVKLYFSDSDNMGTLRNIGVKNAGCKRWLYFAGDDELLPNAIEEILKKNTDMVALKYWYNGEEQKSAVVKSEEEITKWREHFYLEGWVSCNQKIYYKEDIANPDLVFLFDCYRLGLSYSYTDVPVAVFHEWEGSFGRISAREGHYKKYSKEIDKYI